MAACLALRPECSAWAPHLHPCSILPSMPATASEQAGWGLQQAPPALLPAARSCPPPPNALAALHDAHRQRIYPAGCMHCVECVSLKTYTQSAAVLKR